MKKIKEIIEIVIIYGTICLAAAGMIAFAYLIVTSDLPDWFKFLLLK